MWTKHHKKRKIRPFRHSAITVAFLSYFGYHSIHGDYGLRATECSSASASRAKAELAVTESKREHLENQVALLSDGSLDKDMLDEKARFGLNMSRATRSSFFIIAN
jgi:cell division protein FtsB